ncbi:tripartite tricarboxylate transporter TctB family protein [Propionivibrio limicola]|uniref:tripartite tricarboxylate transporter TctB family protein n=1 Tax=Propionivibrio limicola TaxID=167645 RepID=UPI00129182EF|nr:tripartite tricarboxylate transporter TctB family protein [Propionivibrio limicola]
MSEHAKDGSIIADHKRPKGEYKMMALLFIICVALFVDSLNSEGLFQGVSAGPGSIPQLVGGSMIIMIIALAMQFLKKGYKEGTFGDLLHHLFDRDVVILLITLTIYGFIVETIHFVPATFLFLVSTMYLLEPKKLWLKVLVSAGTLGVLYLIFTTLFQVVLP